MSDIRCQMSIKCHVSSVRCQSVNKSPVSCFMYEVSSVRGFFGLVGRGVLCLLCMVMYRYILLFTFTKPIPYSSVTSYFAGKQELM